MFLSCWNWYIAGAVGCWRQMNSPWCVSWATKVGVWKTGTRYDQQRLHDGSGLMDNEKNVTSQFPFPSPKTCGREVNWSLRGEFQIPIPWIRGVFKTCFALTSRNFSCDTMDFSLLYSIPSLSILHRGRMMSAFIPDVLLLTYFRFLFFHELAQEQRIYTFRPKQI